MRVVTQAYRFALDPTPAQARNLCSHAGAARFAYNFGLALVKERLDRRRAGEDVEVPWTLPLSERTYRCEHCGLVLDRDENAARNLQARATQVDGSGPETKNARSRPQPGGRTENPCKTRPARAADRPRSRQLPNDAERQTGIAFEQSEAA